MPKLHFLLEGNSLGEFALDKERITIGRRPSNQIHIDNLTVSGEHAVIVTIGNDSFLEDLNSTNGTFVNGKAIKKYVLQHNDVIEFGKYQLKYINPSQVNATQHDVFEKTMMMPLKKIKLLEEIVVNKQTVDEVLVEATSANDLVKKDAAEKSLFKKNRGSVSSTMVTDKLSIQPDPPVIESIGRLYVLSGASIGRELVLNKTMTTLGKPGSQVAVINRRPNGYFITHVDGNNLPIVNGQSIGVQAHALNNQDVVELAGTKMKFSLK